MMKIFKYPLHTIDVQAVYMPRGARLLHADDQGGVICLWAEVDPDQPSVGREIAIVGTGYSPPPGGYKHLSTVLMGEFVRHVYYLDQVPL